MQKWLLDLTRACFVSDVTAVGNACLRKKKKPSQGPNVYWRSNRKRNMCVRKGADAALTCASQHVTDADDEQDPGGGRGPRQRVLPQPPVAFPLGQKLQEGE